jgi:hypothetical protein
MAIVCGLAASSLGVQIYPSTDDLDDNCPPPKMGGQLLRYWPAGPHLEGYRESNGS